MADKKRSADFKTLLGFFLAAAEIGLIGKFLVIPLVGVTLTFMAANPFVSAAAVVAIGRAIINGESIEKAATDAGLTATAAKAVEKFLKSKIFRGLA